MSELIIPQINNNDTHAVLVEWCAADGAQVTEGDIVAILETSKSTFDLAAEDSGVLQIEQPAGEEYAFGERIGQVGNATEPKPTRQSDFESSQGGGAGPTEWIITDGAKRIIEERGIDSEQLKSLGKRIIREKDLAQFIGESLSVEPLPENLLDDPQQLAIAKVVSRSHRDIPAAFLLKRVYCDQAISWLKELSQRQNRMISLPDLFVSELGQIHSDFPFFFANADGNGLLKKGLAAHIGVTFDFGKGLFIPVIEEVDRLTLEEVSKRMMKNRMKAMRGRFSEGDLSGGSISISLNTETDTELVCPLILPPQTCMISLSAILSEVALNEEGQPYERHYFNLGVAYDHRYINGYQSQEFAIALKERIERIGLSSDEECE